MTRANWFHVHLLYIVVDEVLVNLFGVKQSNYIIDLKKDVLNSIDIYIYRMNHSFESILDSQEDIQQKSIKCVRELQLESIRFKEELRKNQFFDLPIDWNIKKAVILGEIRDQFINRLLEKNRLQEEQNIISTLNRKALKIINDANRKWDEVFDRQITPLLHHLYLMILGRFDSQGKTVFIASLVLFQLTETIERLESRLGKAGIPPEGLHSPDPERLFTEAHRLSFKKSLDECFKIKGELSEELEHVTHNMNAILRSVSNEEVIMHLDLIIREKLDSFDKEEKKLFSGFMNLGAIEQREAVLRVAFEVLNQFRL